MKSLKEKLGEALASGNVLLNKNTPLKELTVHINGSDDKLVVNYQPQTSRALFDLCDLDGRVLHTAWLNQNGTTSLQTNRFDCGTYLLCILDGDEIIKKRIEL